MSDSGADTKPSASLPGRDRRLLLVMASPRVHLIRPVPARRLVVLGRGEVDLKVPDPSVSRAHANLHVGELLALEDLGSSNGTWVNNVRVEPRKPVPFHVGDVARLGDVMATLHWSEPEDHAPADADGDSSSVVVGTDRMRDLHAVVGQIARTPISVLILGETGVGKEVIARRLHACSPRATRPFVSVNCAALSEALLESELFGHEKGAFTGADKVKSGLLEVADGGTVFLDEIGDMPLALQAKVLRVVETRSVLRVGALHERAIDVRFVAATNKDLGVEMREKRFRPDLFFRINGFTLVVPPLRERVAEIDPLVRTFAARFARELGRPTPGISAAALARLERHGWPGNVRELKHVTEQAVAFALDTIDVEHLRLDVSSLLAVTDARASSPGAADPNTRTQPLLAIDATGLEGRDERERIRLALEACAGNQSRAAELLKISRRTLLNKLDLYALPRPKKRRRADDGPPGP